jgi:hypothetical protein
MTEFRPIASAPRDGTFIRLRFRPNILRPAEEEAIGCWQDDAILPAGGYWRDREGGYIGGPMLWAPEAGGFH